jgi:hypothetical protein
VAESEHTTAALGDSEKARINSSPRAHIPEFIQAGEELSKVGSSIGRKDSWHILQE